MVEWAARGKTVRKVDVGREVSVLICRICEV
jgi:hypothetical protein